MGLIWGPPGSCRPQMGPMLAPWTLLSGQFCKLLRQQLDIGHTVANICCLLYGFTGCHWCLHQSLASCAKLNTKRNSYTVHWASDCFQNVYIMPVEIITCLFLCNATFVFERVLNITKFSLSCFYMMCVICFYINRERWIGWWMEGKLDRKILHFLYFFSLYLCCHEYSVL